MKKISAVVSIVLIMLFTSLGFAQDFRVGDQWKDIPFGPLMFHGPAPATWLVPIQPQTFEYKHIGDTIFVNISMTPGGILDQSTWALQITFPEELTAKDPDVYRVSGPCVVFMATSPNWSRVPAMYEYSNRTLTITPVKGQFEDDFWPAEIGLGVNIQFLFRTR